MSTPIPPAIRVPAWLPLTLAAILLTGFEVTVALTTQMEGKPLVLWATFITAAGAYVVGSAFRLAAHREVVSRYARSQADPESTLAPQPARWSVRVRGRVGCLIAALGSAVMLVAARMGDGEPFEVLMLVLGLAVAALCGAAAMFGPAVE